MQLSKVIPTHKKVVEFNWCKKDWLQISPRYREIRGKSRNPMDSCFWCGHKFADGEMMALAQPKTGTNKTLCSTCAEIVLST